MYERERRAFPRLRYRTPDQCPFVLIAGQRFAVSELSRGGLRYLHGEQTSLQGDAWDVAVVFPDDETLLVAGVTLVREELAEIVLHFPVPVPENRIAREWKRAESVIIDRKNSSKRSVSGIAPTQIPVERDRPQPGATSGASFGATQTKAGHRLPRREP